MLPGVQMRPGMMPTLRLARRDEPRAVRAEQARALLLHERIDARHVEHRHAFGDADDELDARVGRFHDRVGREHRRHVDDATCSRPSPAPRRATVLKIGTLSSNFWPPLPGVTPATTFVPYSIICLRVERAVAAGDALHDERRVLVDEDAHAAFPPFASATAFFTASSMSDDAEKPFSCRIFIAISSLVPVRRMTIGTLSGFCFRRRHDAVGDVIGARDAAEDVEQDRLHVRVGRDDA